MSNTFGEWLKGKRGRRGDPGFVTQLELARRLEVDRSYIVQLEDPNRPLPTYPTRQKIHAALGTTEDELKELGIIPRAMIVHIPTATAVGEALPVTIESDTARRERIKLIADQLDGVRLPYAERMLCLIRDSPERDWPSLPEQRR